MSAIPLRKSFTFPITLPTQPILVGIVLQDNKEYPIYACILEISPKLAAEFLSRMGKIQRSLKPVHMKSICRDMLRGKFMFTGEPVIFSEVDQLIDGQHRCQCSCRTDKPFTAMVLFGVPEASYRAMNVTAKRTGADTLRMAGYANASALSGAAGWLYRWENEAMLEGIVVTPIEIDEIISEHPGLIESLVRTQPCSRLGNGHAFPAFCHYLFKSIDENMADRFFDQLGTDVGHEAKSPILALRRFITNKSKLVSNRQKITAYFKAWNLFRAGKKVEMIRIHENETIPDLI